MSQQTHLTHDLCELLKTIQFIHRFNREATVGLEQSLVQLSQTLDDLSAHVYDLIKENRNTFTSKERFEAGKHADQLLETKDLILTFHQQIQGLEDKTAVFALEPSILSENNGEIKSSSEVDPKSTADNVLDDLELDLNEDDLDFDLDKLELELELDFDEEDLNDFIEVEDEVDETPEKQSTSQTLSTSLIEQKNDPTEILGRSGTDFSTIWDCDLTLTPKYFKFDGVRTAVSSWSELFEKACQTFYQKNEFKLRSYIGKTAYGNGSINHCYFVVYPNSRRDYFIFESFKHGKLYVERETDAFKIRSLLIKMIHDYGYQTSDFVVYC